MIVDALEKKMYCVGGFIDLKNAFDTVDHNLLIKKLSYYGIRGIASTLQVFKVIEPNMLK